MTDEQIEKLKQDIRELRGALEEMLYMWDRVMSRATWGTSFLDTNTIDAMNTAPLSARKALRLTKESDNEHQSDGSNI